MIDRAGDGGGTESVVDIDYRDAGGATVQHRQQGGESSEARAISDARRHSHYGHVDETADYARQRALHASDDNDDASGDEAMVFR